MACGGTHSHQVTTAVKRMANEGVPPVVNCHFRLTFRSEALAAHLEPLTEITTVEGVAERITMLAANKVSIIVGPLLTAELLPRAEIVESALVPCQRNFARLVPLGDLLADPNFRLAAVHLNIAQDQAADLRSTQARATRESKDHPIHAGVQGSAAFSGQVVQNAADFVRLEDFRSINGPSCHYFSPFLLLRSFDCIPQFWSETVEKSNEFDCKRCGMQSNPRGRKRRIDGKVVVRPEESHTGAVFHERQDDFPLLILQLV
jgi:hypothetical protein